MTSKEQMSCSTRYLCSSSEETEAETETETDRLTQEGMEDRKVVDSVYALNILKYTYDRYEMIKHGNENRAGNSTLSNRDMEMSKEGKTLPGHCAQHLAFLDHSLKIELSPESRFNKVFIHSDTIVDEVLNTVLAPSTSTEFDINTWSSRVHSLTSQQQAHHLWYALVSAFRLSSLSSPVQLSLFPLRVS